MAQPKKKKTIKEIQIALKFSFSIRIKDVQVSHWMRAEKLWQNEKFSSLSQHTKTKNQMQTPPRKVYSIKKAELLTLQVVMRRESVTNEKFVWRKKHKNFKNLELMQQNKQNEEIDWTHRMTMSRFIFLTFLSSSPPFTTRLLSYYSRKKLYSAIFSTTSGTR